MKRLLASAVSLGLVAAMAGPATAGGPADKATGSGSWVNAQGNSQTVVFDAHEAEGDRPAKGTLYQEALGPGGSIGTFTVDIQEVEVHPDGACFGGPAVAATGDFAGRVGQWRWTAVKDGGAGVDETGSDYLRGLFQASKPSFCSALDTGDNGAWWGGNVQIHIGKSYDDPDAS